MQRIVPNVWRNGTAEQAGEYYASVLPNATSVVTARYPTEGLLEFQQDMAGLALVVDVVIDGYRIALVNADDTFAPNPSISFILNFDPLMFGGDEDAARRALDQLWTALGDGGSALMPLEEYPFSKYYGWMQDRYGVSWQLMLTDPAGDPRPFVIPQLMFGGAAHGQARAALDKYTGLFIESEVGNVYPAPDGNSIMFGEFRVGEQWFAVTDGGGEQAFSFTCGVSLEVSCHAQAELDRIWNALSAVPEAEQCGWLADEFGVSWQVVPSNLGELMQRPGAYEKLMGMKKIVIAEF